MNRPTVDGVLKSEDRVADAARLRPEDIDFDAAVREHRAFLLRIAVASTRNATDAEDVVQDALLRAHRGLSTFRGDCPLRIWLARIVVRLAINHHRSLSRRLKHWVFFSDLEPQTEGEGSGFDPADPAANVDREALMDVRKHVARLDAQFRVPLMMLAGQGMTIPEIAAVLEVPEGTVKSRIFYARRKLKEGMGL